jgi:ankyrin repeat protein
MSVLEDFAFAIEVDNINKVRSILASGAVDESRLPGALLSAAFFGHTEIVELFLNAGVRIESDEYGGYSACHAAAQSCSLDTMRLVLSRHPDLALKDSDGNTALSYAIQSLCEEMICC